ncbi:MAG: polysaccharide deacetylase family protein [Chloroflexi bacterium]|nr:polysaccharide deacetylase family protein [Chloroflexota bacterium]
MPLVTRGPGLFRLLVALAGLAAVIACGPTLPSSPPATASPKPAPFAALLSLAVATPWATPTPTPTAMATATATPPPVAAANPNPAPARGPVAAAPTAIAVRRGDGGQSALALTFDMDSGAGHTAQLLDLLGQDGIKATFAVTGVWAKAQPALLKRIFAEGHLIINHSWDHPAFTKLSREQRQQQVEMTDSLIQGLVGVSTKPYFRPPYGAYDSSVLADVREIGYRYNVMWSIDPQGWRGKSAQQVAADVLANARDGAIVLFHVSARGDYEALPQVIAGLSQAGYRFVTVAQLLGEAPDVTPTPSPTATPAATATPAPTPSPTPAATATPPATPTPTGTPTATARPQPTTTATATPSAGSSPGPTP